LITPFKTNIIVELFVHRMVVNIYTVINLVGHFVCIWRASCVERSCEELYDPVILDALLNRILHNVDEWRDYKPSLVTLICTQGQCIFNLYNRAKI